MDLERNVIMRIEPSQRLSELCGFPYFIEKTMPLKWFIENKYISNADVELMEQGIEIPVNVRTKPPLNSPDKAY